MTVIQQPSSALYRKQLALANASTLRCFMYIRSLILHTLHHACRRYDADNTGNIDEKEMMQALQELGVLDPKVHPLVQQHVQICSILTFWCLCVSYSYCM